jgi:hypothetical protein
VRPIGHETPSNGGRKSSWRGRKSGRTNALRCTVERNALAGFLFHGGVRGVAVLRYGRAVVIHNGVPGGSGGQCHQSRGRYHLSPRSNEESEAGHKNEQFAKSDDPHTDSIRATLIAFKMHDALYLSPENIGIFYL